MRVENGLKVILSILESGESKRKFSCQPETIKLRNGMVPMGY